LRVFLKKWTGYENERRKKQQLNDDQTNRLLNAQNQPTNQPTNQQTNKPTKNKQTHTNKHTNKQISTNQQ